MAAAAAHLIAASPVSPQATVISMDSRDVSSVDIAFCTRATSQALLESLCRIHDSLACQNS